MGGEPATSFLLDRYSIKLTSRELFYTQIKLMPLSTFTREACISNRQWLTQTQDSENKRSQDLMFSPKWYTYIISLPPKAQEWWWEGGGKTAQSQRQWTSKGVLWGHSREAIYTFTMIVTACKNATQDQIRTNPSMEGWFGYKELPLPKDLATDSC